MILKSGQKVKLSSWKKAKKSQKKLTKAQRSQVKRIVNSNMERKYVQTLYAGPFNAQANVAANEMLSLMPKIAVGDGSNQRTGQKIKPKRLVARFVVTFNAKEGGVAAQSADLFCRLWVLKSRSLKDQDAILSLAAPIQFLDDGAGGTQAFNGNEQDYFLRNESEEWQTIKEHRFRLSKASGLLNGDFVAGYSEGNTNPTAREFTVVIPTPANLLYTDETAAVYPTNFAPVWCIGYCRMDGTAVDPLEYGLRVNVSAALEYTDA